MSAVGISERETQKRVIGLLSRDLGYEFLGSWQDRSNNSNIETEILSSYLLNVGYSEVEANKAIFELRKEANNQTRGLYENNRKVYELLRYGVSIRPEAGERSKTIHFIDWKHPQANRFSFAEEVTLKGNEERRPDIVLYINGIAISVLELKNSRVSLGDGIRQNLSNQSKTFNEWFFSTVQFVLAGNDSEGLKYGTILTPEKFFLEWKEDVEDNSSLKLDKYLRKLCDKARLLELIHDFVVFDGVKKLPRPHQYFGIKAAQEFVNHKRSGIIWHTQGSGKSLVMIYLAKWILENKPDARVLIVTDRDELDKQIDKFFTLANVPIKRSSSGADLLSTLEAPAPRLICSLVHKFGLQGDENFEALISSLSANPPKVFGELYVFVDECHRTQSGKLHRTMKATLPGATFVGFTGTPLLRSDKATTSEIFGSYIHTYKFNEGVEDGVVLDLVYESRDIEQSLSRPGKVDDWFELKTKGLNEWQRAALRKTWGTLQAVLSSRSRMEGVVEDIIFDFATKPRLASERGNAILVASSIYEACKYFELFQRTQFKGHCALVTSYNPQASDVTLEEVGANTETDRQFIYNTYVQILTSVEAASNKTKAETYEDQAKARFLQSSSDMKLLIVVDKLLTGFDAPTCSYIYIDKSMQDHGLFQAICRVNRLDGEDKEFGHIVDYKGLFNKVEDAIAVYTSELSQDEGEESSQVLVKDHLAKAKEGLEAALENLHSLCEAVVVPRSEFEHIKYFCGNTELADDLVESTPRRTLLYKGVATLVRSYSNISDSMELAGYSGSEAAEIASSVRHYLDLREVIRRASGEVIDLKAYEADMRHLLDTYIEAEHPERLLAIEDVTLVELIAGLGVQKALETLPDSIRSDQRSVAEVIINNVRSTIVREQVADPAFYMRMSDVLTEVILSLKKKTITYEKFLAEIAVLAERIQSGSASAIPASLNSPGKRAVYNNLDLMTSDSEREVLALTVDSAVRAAAPDDWRGHRAKEQLVKQALFKALDDVALVENLFPIIVQQREY